MTFSSSRLFPQCSPMFPPSMHDGGRLTIIARRPAGPRRPVACCDDQLTGCAQSEVRPSEKSTMNSYLSRLASGALLFALLAGCSSKESDRPTLGTVSGTVMLDNQPAPRLMVTFSPEEGRSSVGVTNESGDYELQYLHNVPGAVIGKHKISITTYYEDDSSPEALRTKEKIPASYNTRTTLTEEVKSGANKFSFDLSSHPSKK